MSVEREVSRSTLHRDHTERVPVHQSSDIDAAALHRYRRICVRRQLQ